MYLYIYIIYIYIYIYTGVIFEAPTEVGNGLSPDGLEKDGKPNMDYPLSKRR